MAKHPSAIFTKLELPPSDDDNRGVPAVLAYLEREGPDPKTQGTGVPASWAKKLPSRAGPETVRTDSGWNWTPSMGSSR